MNPQFSIFLLLVICVLIGWGIWYIVYRPKIEKFEAENTEEPFEAPIKTDCKTYNLRQEVINIFELFLDRKPVVEEIQKYSDLGNEQDIFLAIMNDFQLAASSKKKDELDAMRVDACKTEHSPTSTPPSTLHPTESSAVPPEHTKPKATVESFSDEVIISKAEYMKLKTAFDTFDKAMNEASQVKKVGLN